MFVKVANDDGDARVELSDDGYSDGLCEFAVGRMLDGEFKLSRFVIRSENVDQILAVVTAFRAGKGGA